MPLFAASNGAATLTCFLPRFAIAASNSQNNFWQCLGLAARHSCGGMCSVTSACNWKERYGDNILLSGGQHNVTAVWAVYLCPASTSFTWHGYCTFVKHPGTLLPRCMLCRALDRKHRQMGFFWFIIIITTFFFFLPFLFYWNLEQQRGISAGRSEWICWRTDGLCLFLWLRHNQSHPYGHILSEEGTLKSQHLPDSVPPSRVNSRCYLAKTHLFWMAFMVEGVQTLQAAGGKAVETSLSSIVSLCF